MPQLEKYLGKVYLWPYIPNLPAAISFATLFLLLALAQTWKMYRTKLWFCIPFVLGGLCLPLAYTTRVIAHTNTASLALFILQALFLLLPPVLFAATLYMTYSHLVRAVHGSRFSPLSMKWCTRIFVLSDITCLNIQSTGAGLLAKPKNMPIGNAIVSAGIALHCVVFVGFMYCCVCFQWRFSTYLKVTGGTTRVEWRACLGMLHVTSAVILARNVFRLVEYVMGKEGYLLVNEWPVYVFDGVLMAAVMVVFFVWYPDRLQRHGAESMMELTGDGEASVKTEGSVVLVSGRSR